MEIIGTIKPDIYVGECRRCYIAIKAGVEELKYRNYEDWSRGPTSGWLGDCPKCQRKVRFDITTENEIAKRYNQS